MDGVIKELNIGKKNSKKEDWIFLKMTLIFFGLIAKKLHRPN